MFCPADNIHHNLSCSPLSSSSSHILQLSIQPQGKQKYKFVQIDFRFKARDGFEEQENSNHHTWFTSSFAVSILSFKNIGIDIAVSLG